METMSPTKVPKPKNNAEESRPADTKTEAESYQRARETKVQEILSQREESFLNEEKVLLQWKSPARVFKERPREFFTTIGAIVVLVCLILLFVKEFLLMAVVIAFTFAAYAYATVKPEDVDHEISTRGIRTGGRFFRWDELGRYWFEDAGVRRLLVVETFLRFPKSLYLIIKKEDEDKVKALVSPYVLLEKPEPDFVDKASEWLVKKVPLDGA